MAKIGNTLQSSPATTQPVQLLSWFFTYNNYKVEDIGILETCFRKYAKNYVFQEEVGESGTPHLQGVVNLTKKMRWTAFKLPKAIHWEPTRNNDASLAYCEKTESRAGKVYKWGFPTPIKTITELYPWQTALRDLAITEPDDRTITWRWESTGNVGKSAFCKFMVVHHKATIVRGGKLADIVNIIFNTDMDACRCVIFDIPRGHEGHVSYTALECIKDGLVTNTKYETGCKVFNPPHVICLANFPPASPEKLSQDRWDIKEL